jgi:hypothetical protein
MGEILIENRSEKGDKTFEIEIPFNFNICQ